MIILPCDIDPQLKCNDCVRHYTSGCSVDKAYQAIKAEHPIKTTPKEGANVQELVKEKFPQQYEDLQLGRILNWDDLDGVLDFLYGARALLASPVTEIIDFIESHCEVVE